MGMYWEFVDVTGWAESEPNNNSKKWPFAYGNG